MKRAIGGLVFLATMALWAVGSTAQAQEGSTTCATPGSIILQGIPTLRTEVVPSKQREIAGYGRAAKSGGCKIDLVCIAMDSGDAAREVARLQCVAVRDLLTNSGFVKADIATSRQNPSAGKVSGGVYFTVY